MKFPLGNRNLFNYRVSFLVLDYNKPKETSTCLDSIRKNTQFDNYEIVFLSNGGKQDYVVNLYNEGVIDRLILNKRNYGCGAGTNALYNYCDTDFMIYVQNDQYLHRQFTLLELEALVNKLQEGYATIDLSGGAGHRDKFSERAYFSKPSVINSNPEKGYGGPGPFETNTMWSEEMTGLYLEKMGMKIFHDWPMLFGNIGRFTVREDKDGKVTRRDIWTGLEEAYP